MKKLITSLFIVGLSLFASVGAPVASTFTETIDQLHEHSLLVEGRQIRPGA